MAYNLTASKLIKVRVRIGASCAKNNLQYIENGLFFRRTNDTDEIGGTE
jgi:hypothetical protein